MTETRSTISPENLQEILDASAASVRQTATNGHLPIQKGKHINDAAIVDRLVNDNLELTHYFVRKWNYIDPSDARSIALEGLLRAAQSYDFETCDFRAWAITEIKTMVSKYWRRRRALKRGWDIPHVHLDQPLEAGGDGGRTIGDVIEDESNKSASETLSNSEVPDAIRKAMALLPERTREVLRMRFGFDGDILSLRDIGGILGISGEAVRLIEIKGLRKLRQLNACEFSNKRPTIVIRKPTIKVSSGRTPRAKFVYRDPLKREQLALLDKYLSAGMSIRAAMRLTGFSKQTVNNRRKYIVYHCPSLPSCSCGRPSGHRGWCSDRVSRSPARMEFLSRWHRFRPHDDSQASVHTSDATTASHKTEI